MEADQTSEAQLLPALLTRGAAGDDVVIASRHVRGGAYRDFPLRRRLLSLVANRLFRLVWRLPGVTDYTIFFRCYRVALLQRAFPSVTAVTFRQAGFAANIELLALCCRAGATVAEVPHVYRYGRKPGPSKMRVLPNLAAHLRLLLDRSCR
jgi:dolichol-phosphate mannosyltransferase